MSSTNNNRILLIGCGRWGQNILRDLKTLECEVTALCNSTESVQRATQYAADHIIDNLDNVNELNGIIIATPTSTHLDVIETVLKFNVPIFVEKPLGINLTAAQRIAEIAGERIFIMDKWRYHHGVEELAAIAKNNSLGEIIGLQIQQLGWGNVHNDVDFIDNIVPHTLSIAYEILGEIPQPKTSYVLKRNGESIAMQALLGETPWVSCNISINSHRYQREIILECSKGVAVLNGSYSEHIEIYKSINAKNNSLGDAEFKAIATDMPLLRQLKAFIDYLNGDAEPKSNAHLGVKIMETILQLRALAA